MADETDRRHRFRCAVRFFLRNARESGAQLVGLVGGAGAIAVLSAFGLVQVCAQPILRRADGIVWNALLVDTGRIRVPLVRMIRRTIAFDRANVLVVAARCRFRRICSHIIDHLWK